LADKSIAVRQANKWVIPSSI